MNKTELIHNLVKVLEQLERVYKCDKCKFEIDRDLNASINIKNSGLKIPNVSVENSCISRVSEAESKY